jgi:hypothetical protein
MMIEESARPSPASSRGASRETITRDPERTFARRIDCSGAETRAPQPSRVGRGLGAREGERAGRGPARPGTRRPAS